MEKAIIAIDHGRDATHRDNDKIGKGEYACVCSRLRMSIRLLPHVLTTITFADLIIVGVRRVASVVDRYDCFLHSSILDSENCSMWILLQLS